MKTIFTSFDHNTAEFYDNHILLTMICIFWSELGLKLRYVALHVTENGFFLNIAPPSIRDHIGSVDCTLGYKATVGRESRMNGGNDVLKNFSVFR